MIDAANLRMSRVLLDKYRLCTSRDASIEERTA